MRIIGLFLICIVLISCRSGIRTGADLSQSDIDFIKNIGLLDNGEDIILFESHSGSSGIRTNGNFFTKERIATYWIDDNDSNKTKIDYVYYWNIDTITITDFSQDWSLASYLEIKTKTERYLKVHVSQEKEENFLFFEKAIEQWRKNRNNSSIN